MLHLTTLDDDHLVYRAISGDLCRIWVGQAVRAHLCPLRVTLPHKEYYNPGGGYVALATAAETALMTPNSDSNLDRTYHG